MVTKQTKRGGYYRIIRHLVNIHNWESLQVYLDGLAGDVQAHIKNSLAIRNEGKLTLVNCENGIIGLAVENGENLTEAKRGLLALKGIL